MRQLELEREDQVEDESIELLLEQAEEQLASEEDDQEAALVTLIESFRQLQREELPDVPQAELGGAEGEVVPIRVNEFVCPSCHLVFRRRHSSDPEPDLCEECRALKSR